MLARLIEDLRRRRVFRVLAAYAVGAWALIEVVDTLGPEFGLPAAATRLAVFAALLALPLVVALSWAYDLRPDSAAARPRSHGLVLGAAAVPLAVGLVAGAMHVLNTTSLDPEAARTLIGEARALVEEGRYAEAYPLLERAAPALPDDSTVLALLDSVRVPVTILSDPPGAVVRALPATASDSVRAGSGGATWQAWGRTPVRDRRMPRFDHLVEIRADGHRPALRLISPSFAFARGPTTGYGAPLEISVPLIPTTTDVPKGLVRVPGGEYLLASPDMGTDVTETLDEFYIDRYEVTNEAYARFVAGGGYEDPAYWETLPPELDPADVPARFTDRTGRPGPRFWRGQTYPEGTADHPVTGISWYEASAYAAHEGRSLPTYHQWEKAARNGSVTARRGYVVPWGVVRGGETGPARSRSQAPGPGPVDEHPFGISPFGAYAMAGNAKEWLANPFGAGRAVTGGSWQDPLYLFSEVGSVDPSSASPAIGFRTVWLDPARRRLSRTQGLVALEWPPVPEYRPVDRSTFELLRRHYEYDSRPANADTVASVETDDWVRQRVEFDGPEGERVIAYLYLPNRALPPYQPLAYVPGNATFLGMSVADAAEFVVGPLVAAGRAVLVVVMKGMTEREYPPGYEAPPTESVAFRDRMVLHATELRLGLDYLATRSDIDMSALAYVGQSWGAGSRLVFAAIDDRYRAVVFIGGGIDERVKPVLPEADNVNFAPHLGVPTLLVNGRQDEEHPWRTRAGALWELLSEPKRLVLLDGQGHVPAPDVLVPAMQEFLDEILGPPELADQPG